MEEVFHFHLGGSWDLPRENCEKIDLKWCVLGYFKNNETNFLDRLKIASCQKSFASCQGILPAAKFGNWQPKKKECNEPTLSQQESSGHSEGKSRHVSPRFKKNLACCGQISSSQLQYFRSYELLTSSKQFYFGQVTDRRTVIHRSHGAIFTGGLKNQTMPVTLLI